VASPRPHEDGAPCFRVTEVTVFDSSDGAQHGNHRYVLHSGDRRHVYATHHWPDGVTTAAKFTRREWATMAARRSP
jgi:hypothetical protein